jgi:short-subunit dehydrogenase
MSGLFDLSGQTALVTGASRGLGQYFARALAGAGANLILTSRRKEDMTPFVEEMEHLGRRVTSLSLDVRDLRSVEALAPALEAYGQVHILVNNAGCNVRKAASSSRNRSPAE